MSNYREDAARKSAQYCPLWSRAASDEMLRIAKECTLSNMMLERVASTQQKVAIRAGIAVEVVQKETFNLDAILKDKSVKAFTDRCQSTPLQKNDPMNDIVVMKDGQRVATIQSKYYKTPKKTANALREIRDGDHHYKDVDQMVVPSDQLPEVKAAARQTELKSNETRPPVADAARDVQTKATDRIRHDNVESKPLSKKDADTLAQDNRAGREKHQEIQDPYKSRSTLKHSLKAAQSAAVVTAVIAGSINVVNRLTEVRDGRLEPVTAVGLILRDTALAATDSALKAGVGTAAVSATTRALPGAFSGTVLQSSLASGGIAGAAICAVDLVECLVLVAADKMTIQELQSRTGMNLFQTGAGTLGASIGSVIGAPAGPPGMFVGAMIGGMITSIAMTVAIENHVERPYREIMDNVLALVAAQSVMKNSLEYLAMAQEVFGNVHVEIAVSERRFDQQIDMLRGNDARLRERLEKL
jgi:hypothetical protein